MSYGLLNRALNNARDVRHVQLLSNLATRLRWLQPDRAGNSRNCRLLALRALHALPSHSSFAEVQANFQVYISFLPRDLLRTDNKDKQLDREKSCQTTVLQ
ncbi:hypothetical protein J6590_038546 [Homalodisca vitripennis]|nr:hypothetical protein J6590_038546 [Homalodisca vitripennis]